MWQLYSVLAGFFLASADSVTKSALMEENEYYIVWIRLLFSAVPLVFMAFWVPVPQNIDTMFWVISVCLAPLELLAIVLYVKAIKISPISLTIPFLAFTPVFLLIISFFLDGETPGYLGMAGVFMIVTGSYIVSSDSGSSGMLEPFKHITSEPGIPMMIAVAFLFSITSTLAKVAISYTDPTFFAVYYYPFLALLFLPILFIKNNGVIIKPFGVKHFIIGLCLTGMVLCHTLAISMTKVIYMIALKRTNLIFSIIFGFLFFKEISVKKKLLGGGIMLGGVFILSFMK